MTPLQITAFVVVYFLLFTAALGAWSAAPWVRTKKKQRELVADVTMLADDAKICDIGCGDGAMLFTLVDRHPKLRAVGYDIATFPLLIGWWTKLRGGARYRNVSLQQRDLFGQDYSDVDAVFVFLLAPSYPKVIVKLAHDLRDDAQVIVEAWPLPGIVPERSIAHTADTLPVYFYRGAQLRAAKQ